MQTKIDINIYRYDKIMVMHSNNTIDILRDSLNDKVEYMRKNIESFQGYLDHIISSIYDNNYNIDTIEKLSNMIDRYYYSVNQGEEVFNEGDSNFIGGDEVFNDGNAEFIDGNSDIDDHLKGMMEASSSENESESNNSDTSESEEESEEPSEAANIKMKAQDKFKVFSENIQNNCVDRKVFNLYEFDDKHFEDYNSYLANTSYGRFKIGN